MPLDELSIESRVNAILKNCVSFDKESRALTIIDLMVKMNRRSLTYRQPGCL
jgi:hypothetical protein